MNTKAVFILRLGLGITFIAMGFIILRDPMLWLTFAEPWIQNLTVHYAEHVIRAVAVLDIILGGFIIIGLGNWFFCFIAALVLAAAMMILPYGDNTVRDFGLFVSTVALGIHSWSMRHKKSQRVIDTSGNEL